MPTNIIQWFPGHMAKTRRLMTENLPAVDLVIEVLDARIPKSSRNPEIRKLIGNKPLLTVLSKSQLADPIMIEEWRKFFRKQNNECVFYDCLAGYGLSEITAGVRHLLAEKMERYREKGMEKRALKAMIVGIPNVGKSSLINKLAGHKSAKVEDRPGVTLTKQWVKTSIGLDLLDMPGVLWPKFDDVEVGENLSMTGAIKDDVVETEAVAIRLCEKLRDRYPQLLAARYKLDTVDSWQTLEGFELFERIGKKRGFLISGGEIDAERTTKILLDEFRSGKIGRITLDVPSEL